MNKSHSTAQNIMTTRNQTPEMICHTYIAPLTPGMKVSIMPLKTAIVHISWVAVSVWMRLQSMYVSSFCPPVTLSTVSWFCCRSRCRLVSSWCRVLFHHSNFVIHHLERKARKNCHHHLVRLYQLVTKALHYLFTAQLYIGDFVNSWKSAWWEKFTCVLPFF